MSLVSREADCGPRKQSSDLCDVGNEDLFPLFPCGIHHLKSVPKITECTAKYSIHIRADKLKAYDHKNGKKTHRKLQSWKIMNWHAHHHWNCEKTQTKQNSKTLSHITADKLKYIPLPKCLKYHRTHHQPLCTVHTSELTKWKTHQQNHQIYYRTHWHTLCTVHTSDLTKWYAHQQNHPIYYRTHRHTLCTYQSWCFEHITSQLMPRTYNIITADALNTKHHHSWCTEHITSSELMHWTHNIIRADAHNITRADTLNT